MNQGTQIRVGIVGIGIMGTAIGTRLLDCGQQVTIFARNKQNEAALAAKGANPVASPMAVAAASEFVILSLNSAAIVKDVVFGDQGVAHGARSRALLIDMSSIDPTSTQQMADELRRRAGMAWLDCPLSGGAPGALAGRLTVTAGGLPEDFERARAVMQYLTGNYTWMGPSGAGQATKLVNQILCAIAFQAVAEATAFAESVGIAVERIPQALAGGRADSRILQEFMPKMARRDFTPTGRIGNMVKDLTAVQEGAGAACISLPLTAKVAEIHRLFVAEGEGDSDNAALMKQFVEPRLQIARLDSGNGTIRSC